MAAAERNEQTEGNSRRVAMEGHVRSIPLRTITVWDCVSLTIGNMLGAGIFIAPGEVLALAGCVEYALLVWLLAGLTVFLGALCYAELGVLFPHSGADYQYLSRAYHPLIGFSYAWSMLLIRFPGVMALTALTAARYLLSIRGPNKAFEIATVAPILEKSVASIIMLALTVLNLVQTRYGLLLEEWVAVFKISFILLLSLSGFVYSLFLGIVEDAAIHDLKDLSDAETTWKNFGFAIYGALWSYDGWNSINLAAGEVISPQRAIPLAVYSAIPTIVFSYLLINLSYWMVLPEETVRKSPSLAIDFSVLVFGEIFGVIFIPIFVAVIAAGALNGLILVTSRLTQICAADHLLPFIFSRVSLRTQTPVPALLLNLALSCIFIFLFTFSSLVRFFIFSSWIFFTLSAAAVLIFRWKEPQRPRPFRVWLAAPVLFLLLSLFLLIFPFFSEQYLEPLAMVLLTVVSVPVWFFFQYKMFPEVQECTCWRQLKKLLLCR